MSLVGKTYLERGEPVTIVAQWQARPYDPVSISDGRAHDELTSEIVIVGKTTRTGPRNVLIRRANGELVIRPFRGLRRKP